MYEQIWSLFLLTTLTLIVNWAQAYDEFLNEQVAAKQRSDSSRGVYVFSDLNPYVGHPNPLKEGQDLFRKGLLSEVVLALEAEVLKNPENAEEWRLLGIAHAENDDDQQAFPGVGPELWANEFAKRQQNGAVEDQWVDEFSKLNVNDWAAEFGQQVGEGAFGEGSSDNWAQAYDE